MECRMASAGGAQGGAQGGWAQGGRRAAESAASPEACRGILRVGEQATKAAVFWQIWHVGVVAGAAAGGGQQLEVGVHSNWGWRGVGMRGKSGCEEVPSSSRCRRANGCGRPAGRRFVVFCARNLAATAREAVGAARARVFACAAAGHGPLHPASMCTACTFGGKRFSFSCACACPREMAR